MAFTKVLPVGISSESNLLVDSINSVGVVTATEIVATTGTFSGNVSVGGTLTYEDVSNIDSVGVITARSGLNVTGGSVGIGTDNPAAGSPLHINGGSDSTNTHLRISADRGLIARLGDTSGAAQSLFDLYDTDGSTQIVKFISGGGNNWINTGGNLGIGTDNPGARLDVEGNQSDTDTVSGNTVFDIAHFNVSGATNQAVRFYHDDTNNVSYLHRVDNGGDLGFSLRNGGANAERVRITSSGNIGIGTDNPTKALHLAQNSDIAIRMDSNNANANARTWEIIVGGNASNNAEMVFRTRQDDGTGGSECARIKRNGVIALPSGGGIDFSATANSSGTMSSELLDDYEEGTWTPNFTGVTYTASVQFGRYTKIGRYVYCTITIDGSISNGSNNIGLEGLPFTADEAGDDYQRSAWHPANGGHMVGLSINDARFRVNGSTMQGVKGATGNTTYMTGNQLTSGTFQFTGDFSYYTSS